MMWVLFSEYFPATCWEVGSFCIISLCDFRQILVCFNVKVEEGHILHQGNEYSIRNICHRCIWLERKAEYTHIFVSVWSQGKILNTISREKSITVRVTVLP